MDYAMSADCNRIYCGTGRTELRSLLLIYFFTLLFQVLTTGSFLTQGSNALIVLTAIHAGMVAALSCTLVANAIAAVHRVRRVEDRGWHTLCIALGVEFIVGLAFATTTYIALDVGLGISKALESSPPDTLSSIPLFVLLIVLPLVYVSSMFLSTRQFDIY